MSSSSAIKQPSSDPRPRRFWRKPWPLRTALGLFALSLVLPAVLFFGLQYRTALVEKQAEVEREGLDLARSVAADIGRELAIKRAQLAALATSQALRDGDYTAFHAQADDGAEGRARAGSRWCAATAPSSSTRWCRPGRCSMPVRQTDVLQRVLRTGQSEESDLFTSRNSKRVVITVFYPVGHGDLVLSGALPVDHLSEVLRTAMPADRIATLLDREGAHDRAQPESGGQRRQAREPGAAPAHRGGARGIDDA